MLACRSAVPLPPFKVYKAEERRGCIPPSVLGSPKQKRAHLAPADARGKGTQLMVQKLQCGCSQVTVGRVLLGSAPCFQALPRPKEFLEAPVPICLPFIFEEIHC